MVLARLVPRDERFFSYFQEAAGNAADVGHQLLELFERYEDVERKIRLVRDLEHRGDEITHRIYKALESTFVTPLDREDIRDLAGKLDDFVDYAEEVARRLRLYRMERPTELARLLARIIADQAEVMARAVALLERERNSPKLRQHIVEINRLEDEGDDALNQALAGLYGDASDIPSLIKAIRWGEIYQLLEDATDRAEDVANTLEGIQTKYA
jgi:predicted phosphate transport protein (TIGR00153 family)